jgi:hypothetical protein
MVDLWHLPGRTPEKLRVTPRYARLDKDGRVHPTDSVEEDRGSDKEMLYVEVVNRSPCKVRILEIGFTLLDSRTGKRRIAREPNTTAGMPFARSLQSRQAVNVYFDIQQIAPHVKKVYVITDRGRVYYGENAVLDEIRWRTYEPFY